MPEIVVMMTQDEYRELFEKERHLAYECLESGEAELVKIGQVMLGRRWAVDDAENARIEAEMEAMWAWLRGAGHSGMPEVMADAGDPPEPAEREPIPGPSLNTLTGAGGGE